MARWQSAITSAILEGDVGGIPSPTVFSKEEGRRTAGKAACSKTLLYRKREEHKGTPIALVTV